MNLAWIASPWALVVALAAYRLSRLWIDDMIPPLPRIREALLDRAADRDADRVDAAKADDRADPHHVAAMNEAGRRALAGGYNTTRLIGPREEAELARQRTYGGQPVASYLVTCYWCAGFWISLAVVLVAAFVPLAVWALPMSVLAVSAITGLIAQAAE